MADEFNPRRPVSPHATWSAPVRFRTLFPSFAAGYFLSFLLRTVNAVIAPSLVGELELSPAALGLVTGSYFLAFGVAQLPVGLLLDRYGPRRVEPALLLTAALGAAWFGQTSSLFGLTAGRALIGLGVSGCLMAPLKAIAAWFPRSRHASLSGWMMVAGGLGALSATVPLELTLHALSWRTVFFVLALAAVVVSAAVAWAIPDGPRGTPEAGFEQVRGLVSVLAHPRFWWIAPLAAFGMGSFMAIQSLWAIPWLMEVKGCSRPLAAALLSSASVAVLLGYTGLGLLSGHLERRGIEPRHLVAGGFLLSLLGLGAIAFAGASGPWAWSLYAVGTSVNVLTFTVLNHGFPPRLAARANTALNLFMFGGSFAVQWGIGLLVGRAPSHAAGLQLGFGLAAGLEAAAWGWFVWRWRRFAPSPRVTPA